jgi:hypothetical protein
MWIRYFDRAELHAEFAHCFRDLNKPELANHHATASIRESSSLYVRSLSFCRTVLAISHLQNNDMEEAIAVASAVVDTAATLQSSRVLSYVADFRARLAAVCVDDPIVQRFNEYADNRLLSSGHQCRVDWSSCRSAIRRRTSASIPASCPSL